MKGFWFVSECLSTEGKEEVEVEGCPVNWGSCCSSIGNEDDDERCKRCVGYGAA